MSQYDDEAVKLKKIAVLFVAASFPLPASKKFLEAVREEGRVEVMALAKKYGVRPENIAEKARALASEYVSDISGDRAVGYWMQVLADQ